MNSICTLPFHFLWNKGKEDPELRFIVEDDKELTLARLALVKAIAITIASGLGIMGIEPVKELRSRQQSHQVHPRRLLY